MQRPDLEIGGRSCEGFDERPQYALREKPTTTSSSIDHDDAKKLGEIVEERSISDLAQYEVVFEKNDPEDPLNWPFSKKFATTGVAILLIFNS